jgi:hypothetical protein
MFVRLVILGVLGVAAASFALADETPTPVGPPNGSRPRELGKTTNDDPQFRNQGKSSVGAANSESEATADLASQVQSLRNQLAKKDLELLGMQTKLEGMQTTLNGMQTTLNGMQTTIKGLVQVVYAPPPAPNPPQRGTGVDPVNYPAEVVIENLYHAAVEVYVEGQSYTIPYAGRRPFTVYVPRDGRYVAIYTTAEPHNEFFVRPAGRTIRILSKPINDVWNRDSSGGGNQVYYPSMNDPR